MHFRRMISIALAFVAITALAGSVSKGEDMDDLSIEDLEQRLVTIDKTCEQLAGHSLRTGIGSSGYTSIGHNESSNTEWVQVDLGEAVAIDEVVLVPVIWRDTKKGFSSDGFPVEFTIIAGTSDQTNVLATFGAEDGVLPRIAPLVVPFAETTASWVRVEATALSPRAWDGKYDLKLAELLVFSGQDNVALQKAVQVSSSGTGVGEWPARNNRYIVDGLMPYLMDAYQGEQSRAFVSAVGIGDRPILTIDLGVTQSVNRVHLHAVDASDTVPQSVPTELGLPPQLIIEGAMNADFSNSVQLTEYHYDSIYDVGPIIMRQFPSAPCRYIRLTAIRPYMYSQRERSGSVIAFSEIEVFSNGHNVALGKDVSSNFGDKNSGRSLSALTDGHNYYGRILDLREWMEELALRHDLEAERPVIAAELSLRYERQKRNLSLMIRIAVLLVVCIGFAILIDRGIRLRDITRLKERFAADLHDELGANLHAIGLFGDLAKDAVDSPEELVKIVDEIRALTERTGAAARFCADMQESDLHGDLVQDMKRVAHRMLADIECDFKVDGAEWLDKLKQGARTDLFLFFKESLVNISRHSGASEVSVRLSANSKEVDLMVSDNGRGLPDSVAKDVPLSLRRRAQLLGAHVELGDVEKGGTCILLKLRLGKMRLRM